MSVRLAKGSKQAGIPIHKMNAPAAGQEQSAACRLLDLVWNNTNRSTGHSCERMNDAMRAALSLAVGARFKFDKGDFAHIWAAYNTAYWIGDNPEWVYAEAVAVGNLSAAVSYEAWKGRKPIIADNVRPTSSTFAHCTSCRKRERLAVGFRFPWKGHQSLKVFQPT